MSLNKLNILQNFSKENYSSYPFPYIEINNALPEDIYEKLKKDYKIFESHFKKNKNFYENNKRIQINTEQILKNKDNFEKSIWFDFVNYHNSLKFFDQLVNIFEKDLVIYYPNIKKIYDNRKNNEKFLSYRSEFNNEKYEFVSDCQPGINTPTNKISSVRGPHVDNPVELFGGLFYLKDDNDDSKGSDLIIYEKIDDIIFEGKAEVKNLKALKEYKKIKYEKNKFVIFLNTQHTIHGVTERSITKYNRNLTNIIIERYKNNNRFFVLKRESNILNNFFNKFLKKLKINV
mgnify:CR=1 FL=1